MRFMTPTGSWSGSACQGVKDRFSQNASCSGVANACRGIVTRAAFRNGESFSDQSDGRVLDRHVPAGHLELDQQVEAAFALRERRHQRVAQRVRPLVALAAASGLAGPGRVLDELLRPQPIRGEAVELRLQQAGRRRLKRAPGQIQLAHVPAPGLPGGPPKNQPKRLPRARAAANSS